MSKPTHKITVSREFKQDGKTKFFNTRVGSGWANEHGIVRCKLEPGIALTSEFSVLPITESDEE